MRFLICAAAAAVLIFAACGDDSNDSSKTPSNQPSTNLTVVRPGSPQSNPSPGGQATVPAETTDGNAPGIPVLNGDIQSTPSGLRYIDEKIGTGPSPSPTQQVTVHYTGWLTDGTKFGSSVGGQPLTTPLNRVIRGWTEGVGSMKVGGKRRLIIPPSLGYGAPGKGPVPPNATLIFDVELLSIQ